MSDTIRSPAGLLVGAFKNLFARVPQRVQL